MPGLPVTPVSGKRTISLFTPSKRLVASTPTRTPTASPSNTINTIFSRAKAALRRGTVPGKITARSSERSQILSFLSHNLGKVKRGAFLYICGPPGTGKTALMNEIYSEYQNCQNIEGVDMTFLNCMSFDRAEEVFDRIIEGFNGNAGFIDAQLEHLFIKRKTMSYDPVDSMLILDWWFWMKWTISLRRIKKSCINSSTTQTEQIQNSC